jgi:heat shock protein HtpX
VAGRVVIAIALLIGFYLLALTLAGGLLLLPYLEWTSEGRLNFLVFLGAVGGAAILWSILPRRARFTKPGPTLDLSDVPRLAKEVYGVVDGTGQPPPEEVYLVPELNAWVGERGRLLGFHRRRVMGLGLPLLQALTVDQFRAVLAHEYGHFYGGDTHLGPWVYRTRATIGRTIVTLEAVRSIHRLLWLLHKPFLWYGKMYLRITLSISRMQEFTADELASRLVGPGPLIEVLRSLAPLSRAHEVYWNADVVPLLASGFRPPLGEGFARFLSSPEIRQQIAGAGDKELRERRAGPYDSHPTPRERIAALGNVGPETACADDTWAISLLDDIPKIEASLLTALYGEKQASQLRPIAWEDVGTKAWVPLWESMVRDQAGALSGMTPASLPQVVGNLTAFDAALDRSKERPLSPKQRIQRAAGVLGVALAAALSREGWTVWVSPGEAVRFESDGKTIKPFEVIDELASAKLTAAEWLARCEAAGIANVSLAGLEAE